MLIISALDLVQHLLILVEIIVLGRYNDRIDANRLVIIRILDSNL